MIGIWSDYAGVFLKGLALATFVLFTVPLTLVPLKWARIMGFEIPGHTDLAVYFGRSVGALAAAGNYMAWTAGVTGVGVTTVLGFLIAVAVMMTLIHAWGAYKKIQPLSETLEIAFWIAIGVASVAVWPV